MTDGSKLYLSKNEYHKLLELSENAADICRFVECGDIDCENCLLSTVSNEINLGFAHLLAVAHRLNGGE